MWGTFFVGAKTKARDQYDCVCLTRFIRTISSIFAFWNVLFPACQGKGRSSLIRHPKRSAQCRAWLLKFGQGIHLKDTSSFLANHDVLLPPTTRLRDIYLYSPITLEDLRIHDFNVFVARYLEFFWFFFYRRNTQLDQFLSFDSFVFVTTVNIHFGLDSCLQLGIKGFLMDFVGYLTESLFSPSSWEKSIPGDIDRRNLMRVSTATGMCEGKLEDCGKKLENSMTNGSRDGIGYSGGKQC